MKVLIAGSSGLLGTAISSALAATGCQIYKLKRNETGENASEIFWDPSKGILDPLSIEGFDVIINLAGDNILGRWTPEKKRLLLDSRISSTNLLVNTISKLNFPPELFINASAIGYYGDRGDELLTESSPAGNGFLPDICKRWEEAAVGVKTAHVRCAILRIGLVLSPDGGALKNMLLPFKLCLGGKIGSGKQYMSWIAIDDIVGAVLHIIQNKNCQGIFNLTSFEPVTNDEFTKTLGGVLQRPTFLTVPAFAVRLLFGELGEALFLSSTRAKPERLLESEYQFLYPHLKDALIHLTSKHYCGESHAKSE